MKTVAYNALDISELYAREMRHKLNIAEIRSRGSISDSFII